jgi:CRP-like cAMP-binding protein
MSTVSSDWPRNRLLLALPARDLKRLAPELERVECPREQILMEPDTALDHVFFPDSGVVSVLAVYDDGKAIEMATVGREGCTGVQAILGAKVGPGFSGVQRCSQFEAASGALAAYDARPQ